MIIRCIRSDGTCTGYYHSRTIEHFMPAPGSYADPFVMLKDGDGDTIKFSAVTVEILTDHGEIIQTLELNP